LVSGGSYPQPGEISHAYNGVFFLDELPEFKRTVLEVMHLTLEDREVTTLKGEIYRDLSLQFWSVSVRFQKTYRH
jgi:predicted ATPase with chaperone activity